MKSEKNTFVRVEHVIIQTVIVLFTRPMTRSDYFSQVSF